MTVRNLTPHDLVIYNDAEEEVRLPVEIPGGVRVTEHTRRVGDVRVGEESWVPLVETTFAGAASLPAPVPGVTLIVSEIVARAHPARADLVCPDTGPEGAVRDAAGRIIGVRRLRRVVR